MPVNIRSVKGYYYLNVWVMANIIQLSTLQFCRRFLNVNNDPCHRLFDQMTMAARSATANIAEGLSRQQTSMQTAMSLTDVARASLSELLGDFFFIAMADNIEPWSKHSREFQTVTNIQLDQPKYTDDWQREACLHIQRQKQRFDPYTQHESIEVCLNSMIVLVNRAMSMLQRLIENQLDTFRHEGGFSENLTQERLTARNQQAVTLSAPSCPKCGSPMVRRWIKRGERQGHEFWGCADYPKCDGVRNINENKNS